MFNISKRTKKIKKLNMFFLSILITTLFTMTACTASMNGVIINSENDMKPLNDIRYFKSIEELQSYLQENKVISDILPHKADLLRIEDDLVLETSKNAQNISPGLDFSQTNVQVTGVDEGDFIKSDGKHFYIVRDSEIAIVEGYPVDTAQKISSIKDFGINHQNTHLFLGNKKLIAVTDLSESHLVRIYDLTDIKKPTLTRKLEISGRKINTRQIGNIVYVMSAEPIKSTDKLPWIKEDDKITTVNPQDIGYFENSFGAGLLFNKVVAIDIEKSQGFEQSIVLGTNDGIIYMSMNNLYMIGADKSQIPVILDELLKNLCKLTGEKYKKTASLKETLNRIEELAEKIVVNNTEKFNQLIFEAQDKIWKSMCNTRIYKFKIKDGKVNYKTSGIVRGQVLNQFSMDEYNNYFRIAVTEDEWNTENSKNSVYILNEKLEVIGKIEDIAKGERIYSARFMGDKAYMITFRQIDPLFVLDLSDPYSPKLLGELKMPGFSDYLHPYDENHLIGIGKEIEAVVEKHDGVRINTTDLDLMLGLPIIRTIEKGVKVSLFDVSDPLNPKEVDKFVIDNPASNTLASQDHKAVLFDKKRDMLVIPISYYNYRHKIVPEPIPIPMIGENSTDTDNVLEEDTAPVPSDMIKKPTPNAWHGVYVFNINPDIGVNLKGIVEHKNTVQRSLYIDKFLYTVSVLENTVKISDIENLTFLRDIDIKKEIK